MKKALNKQDLILYDMQKMIDKIRIARIQTGEEIKNYNEIWKHIDILYNSLDRNYQLIFDDYVN